MLLNCTLEKGEDGKFYYVCFYHQKKKYFSTMKKKERKKKRDLLTFLGESEVARFVNHGSKAILDGFWEEEELEAGL